MREALTAGRWAAATGVVVVSFALASLAYAVVHLHPVVYDALGYWFIHDRYRAEGLFADYPNAGVRTYLYPMLLLWTSRFAAALGQEVFPVLFGLQFVLHVASSALLVHVVMAGRPRMAVAVFAALVWNPFVLPYLASSLTDATALACFQAWLAAMVASRRNGGHAARWLALAAVLAGIVCVLRPAYVWLLALTPLLAPWSRIRMERPGVPARRWPLVLALLCALPPLLPQMAINQVLFDRPTPLPAGGLAGSQLNWGISYLKYATAPAEQGRPQMFYANPLAGNLRGDEGLAWYFEHPIRGAATLAVKFVGAFDFDFLQPYVWDRDPPLQWPWRITSLLLLLLGLRGTWLVAVRGREAQRFGGRWVAPVVLAAWCIVTLPTAIELRFSLPMLSLFVLLATVAVDDARRLSPRGRIVMSGLALACLAIVVAIARFVSAQNVLL